MTTTVRQLTIQIPEHAQPGSVLSIPVKGQQDTVKVRIPDGFSPGDVLVLTKEAGSEEWMVEAPADTIEENPDQAQHQLLTAEGLHDLSETEPFPTSATLPPEGPVLSQESPCPESESPSACTVRLDTTLGAIDIIVRPDWAPHGARRFLNLAAAGDLDDLAFYRVVKGCIAQFGLPTKRQWPPLPDDPPTGVPFLLGAVSLVADRKDARKSTLVICTGDMSHCFGQHAWETPIGAVAEYSLEALKRIESMYGDIAECGGRGPSATRIILDGNSYLQAQFPQLTYIRAAWPLDGLVHQEFNISTPPPIQDDRFAALESMVEQVETREQLVGPADDLHPAPSTGKIDQPVDESSLKPMARQACSCQVHNLHSSCHHHSCHHLHLAKALGPDQARCGQRPPLSKLTCQLRHSALNPIPGLVVFHMSGFPKRRDWHTNCPINKSLAYLLQAAHLPKLAVLRRQNH